MAVHDAGGQDQLPQRENLLHIITIEGPIEFLHNEQEVHRQSARDRDRYEVVRPCA